MYELDLYNFVHICQFKHGDLQGWGMEGLTDRNERQLQLNQQQHKSKPYLSTVPFKYVR